MIYVLQKVLPTHAHTSFCIVLRSHKIPIVRPPTWQHMGGQCFLKICANMMQSLLQCVQTLSGFEANVQMSLFVDVGGEKIHDYSLSRQVQRM